MEAELHGDTRVRQTMPESIETLTSLLKLSPDDLEDIGEYFEDILNQGL